MSEPRMAALVGEGDHHTDSPAGRRTRISRAGSQHTDSPGRRTRISRAHLTGSLHGHHSKENPILLVNFGQSFFPLINCCNLLAKEIDKKVRQNLLQLNFAFPAPREQIHDEFADGCAFSLGEQQYQNL